MVIGASRWISSFEVFSLNSKWSEPGVKTEPPPLWQQQKNPVDWAPFQGGQVLLDGVQGHVKGRIRTRCNNSQPMAISSVHWRPRKTGRTCTEDKGLQRNETVLTTSRHFPCRFRAWMLSSRDVSHHAHCSMQSLLRGKRHCWGGWTGRLSPDEKPKQKPWWSVLVGSHFGWWTSKNKAQWRKLDT